MIQLLGFLFFLSGLAGIVYEIVWIRVFTDILGSHTQSISASVTAFLLGLGLGSLAFGRLADRTARPLRWYGLVEICVGLSAVAFYFLFLQFSALYRDLHRIVPYAALKYSAFLVAFVFITIPAAFIGGTFPLLSRTLIHLRHRLQEKIGLLYSVNTLGAAAGVVLAGMLLVQWLGYCGTLLTCAAINLLIGGVALCIEQRQPQLELENVIREEQTTMHPESPGAGGPGYQPGFIVALAFCSGFVTLGYEIVWSRIFSYIFKGWMLGFAMILCLYLLGIAIGSRFLVKALPHRRPGPELVGRLHLAIAIISTAIAGIMLLPHQAFPFLLKVLCIFPLVFVIMTLAGALFPLMSAMHAERMCILGHSIGSVFCFNTWGNVTGSLAAGFLLIPWLGTEVSYQLMLALGLLLYVGTREKRMSFALGCGLLAAWLAVAWLAGPGLFSTPYYLDKCGADAKIRCGKENHMDLKVVVDTAEHRYLMAGPFISGATDPTRQRVQTLQGHLPMMVHPDPRSVVEIGYGIGQIARMIDLYQPKRLDLVEIDPDMIPMADRFFGSVNGRVSQKPHVHVTIMDGRHFLSVTTNRYDLVMSDTFVIISEGSTRLYTREHFLRAKARLTDDGLVMCWVPGNLPRKPARSILKTFRQVFPQYIGWHAPFARKQIDLFFLGSRKPFSIDLAQLLARWENVAKPSLNAIGITNPSLLLSGFFNQDLLSDTLFEDVDIHTEDKPYLDFHLVQFDDSGELSGIAYAIKRLDRKTTRQRFDACFDKNGMDPREAEQWLVRAWGYKKAGLRSH